MALCTLELDSSVFTSLPASTRDKQVINLATRMLDITHDVLDVPDPIDREMRIVVRPGQSQIVTEFTVGGVEYPVQRPGQIYLPSADKIREANEAIRTAGLASAFQIGRSVMKAWSGTFFLLREEGIKESLPNASPEVLQELQTMVARSELTVVFPEDKLESASGSKETSITSEGGNVVDLKTQLADLIAEKIGKTNQEVLSSAKLLPVHIADTEWAVELNLQIHQEANLSRLALEHLGRRILSRLDHSVTSKRGTAEVWVRQGFPATEVATS